jgi:hypothetical protein
MAHTNDGGVVCVDVMVMYQRCCAYSLLGSKISMVAVVCIIADTVCFAACELHFVFVSCLSCVHMPASSVNE